MNPNDFLDYNDDDGSESDYRFQDCEATAATAKALRVRFEDGSQRWVPRSQIDDDSEVWKPGDKGTLVITAWLAERWAEEG